VRILEREPAFPAPTLLVHGTVDDHAFDYPQSGTVRSPRAHGDASRQPLSGVKPRMGLVRARP
jgi:hypothetical protein